MRAAVRLAAFLALLVAAVQVVRAGERAMPLFDLSADAGGELPARLSETGVFTDLRTLSPATALVPYELNIPFWSDGAAKRRWVAVPEGEAIRFSATEEWTFPAGTSFVKHFELPAESVAGEKAQRLETRILVCDGQGGVRGASYRWREDGSDADLVTAPLTRSVSDGAADESPGRTWYFPGPDDCRKCHLPAAGGVLGVNTRQINRVFTAADGHGENQLLAWSRLGLLGGFEQESLPELARLSEADDSTASVEIRARSFLDANCAYCHRPGGAVADFDARFDTPLMSQNLIGVPARINLGIDGAKFVAPNDPWRSMVLVRVGMLGSTGMPPLAHQRIDHRGVELLREWIGSMPGEPTLAPPVIERMGESEEPVRVALRHDDPEALIRYTLDGGTPGKSSPIYSGPIVAAGPTTVRARAYRPGWNRSIAVYATFVGE